MLRPTDQHRPTSIESGQPTEKFRGTELAERLQSQLEFLSATLATLNAEAASSSVDAAVERQIADLRASVVLTAEQLQNSREQAEKLARAQADAIVYSAEVIEELEETKRRLSEAHAAAARAADDTQRLADTIFARTTDVVLILRDERCVSFNDKSLELFNCTRQQLEEVWPHPFTAARLGDGAAAEANIREIYRSLIAGGPSQMVEMEFLRGDGRSIWCELRMTAFEMQSQTHVMANVSDVTDRKNFESQLRGHRDFLRSVINAVPDPFYVTDNEQRFILANDSYCQTFDLSRSEIVGRHVCEIMPDDDADMFYYIGSGLDDDQSGEQLERTHRLSDGTKCIHSLRRSVFEDPVTGEAYFITLSRDVTQERQYFEQLQLLASVFNNAAEGVAILDADGRIVKANPRFGQMFDQQDLSGRNIQQVMNLGITDWAREFDEISKGFSWAQKVKIDSAVGRPRWCWVSISPSECSSGSAPRAILLASDVTQIENSQKLLQQQAMHDNVTGLPNRRYFKSLVDSLVRQASRNQSSFAICFIDLDDFKIVNDSLGHANGDLLLVEVGKRLSQVLGAQAFVARFGGDEFAAIFPGDAFTMQEVELRVADLVVEFRKPFALGVNEATIGLSLGLAAFSRDGLTADSLMSNADLAMYAAKAAGKNQAFWFNKEMQARAENRHVLQRELRTLLQGDGISLAYQPKVCALTGAPRGCEALARWIRSDGSSVSPAEFIPIAEQSGMILPLGELVLSRALRSCAEWAARDIQLFPLAVNISPQQLRSLSFVDCLMSLLEEYDARPEWLELEITESAVVEDIDRAIEMMRQLRSLGFRIAIDDFGTGYSSLNYIRHFNIDTLKVDRSFVSDLHNDRNCRAIAQSIVSLGRGLGLTIVAEGVETAFQRDFLAEAGCDILQGYLISRPVSQAEIEAWFHSCSEHAGR